MIFDGKCDELRAEIKERNRSRAVRRRDKRTRDGQQTDQQQRTPQSVAESDADVAGPSNGALKPEEELVQRACTAVEAHPPHHHTASSSGVYQCVFQSVVVSHLYFQAPVFYMPSSVRLGDDYGLHFFEPRYRLLISEVMSAYPVSARRGDLVRPVLPGLYPVDGRAHGQRVMDDDIKASLLDLLEKNAQLLGEHYLPTFIHAHQSPLRPNVPATIVQVSRCAISPDGSADVLLSPMAYIWLDEIWERPGTGGLMEARGIRMSRGDADAYERWCRMSIYGNGDGRGRAQMLPIP